MHQVENQNTLKIYFDEKGSEMEVPNPTTFPRMFWRFMANIVIVDVVVVVVAVVAVVVVSLGLVVVVVVPLMLSKVFDNSWKWLGCCLFFNSPF